MNHIASPQTGDTAIEQEIKSKGLTAPLITPAYIEANIASEHYHSPNTAGDQCWTGETNGALDTLTFCVLVLRNGFTVTGESACASPKNFTPRLAARSPEPMLCRRFGPSWATH